jgi:hypothetical protein
MGTAGGREAKSLNEMTPNWKLKSKLLIAVVLIVFAASARPVFAVEGGIGRPISGAAIAPYAGLVPSEPGFAVTVGEAYYNGSISGAIPIGNFNIQLGIDMAVSFTPVAVSYIWPTTCKEWNFASAASFPLAYVDVEANGTVGSSSGRKTDHTFGLFDLAFTPLVASYHISQTDHVALSITVWTPTGDYNPSRLAVLSLNNWTVIPGVGYTKVFPKQNIELTGIWQVQFYTENPATNYQNGVLSDLEATVIKRFKCGVGIGVIGSWIEQVSDDSGATADQFHGFSGRAFGVGPIITYTRKLGKTLLDLNGRFVPEFGNKNRVQGNLFQFAATVKF